MKHRRIGSRSETSGLLIALSLLLLASPLSLPAVAQLDEEDEFRAGLIARYTDQRGHSVERIDSRVSFVWNAVAPDPRIEAKAFKTTWSGYLMSQSRGDYALSVYAAGKVRITLGGKVVLDRQSAAPVWMDAKAVELPFDWHPLEIQFEKSAPDARISLFWKGPGFRLEPIGERWFYHDREKSLSGSFHRGEMLVRALRCGGCHTVPGQSAALQAPSLDRLAGNISHDWLVNWLTAREREPDEKISGQDDWSLSRRMPHFDLSPDNARHITKYLLDQSKRAGISKLIQDKVKPKTDVKAGEKLLMTVGCLACHQLDRLGTQGLFDGGDLTRIANKRPPEFFANWLAAPEKVNRGHRMPVFSLTAKERHNMAAFLATCKTSDADDFAVPTFSENDPDVERGRQLFAKHRCNACHEIADESLRANSIKLTSIAPNSDWKRSCLCREGQREGQPHYALNSSSQADIQTYLTAFNEAVPAPAKGLSARQILVENNCLSCHARGLEEGLAPRVLEVAKAHRQFEAVVPAMIPPSLDSVGDKLLDTALADMIARKGDPHRPWLEVRMPRFPLSEIELERLVQHFVDVDRIPARAAPSHAAKLNEVELRLAGARLVTSAGFGCTSCHRVGDAEPPNAPLNTRGPGLSQLGKRIRRQWYDRWVRDPARIVPKMEMPSVQLAVRGVLDDRLDEQLDAVWQALNQPGFQPPTPNPVRVVRRSGLPERHEPAAVLTDVIQSQGETFVKPLVIGLQNRHSVMFDLATNRLAGWWIGDVARQRTKGKTWFWESGGTELFAAAPQTTELTLEFDGEEIKPRRDGQFVTEADQWRQVSNGVELEHRLRFQLPGESRHRIATFHVTERIQNLPSEAESSGFLRTVTLRDVPEDVSIVLQVVDTSKLAKNSISGDKRRLALTSRSQVEIAKPDAATFTDAGAIRLARSPVVGELEVVLRYETSLPVDRFPVEAPRAASPPRQDLAVVPGFEATRLPIADQWMPTGLAWRPDGALVVSSLKGRVWIARDSDGDGLEDEVAPFSDELAAPYGVAACDDYIDVVNKYAVLRLFDQDGDGRADRTVTVASGWGHTTDYHDWVVGLPRDELGNYYVAIPCQQDDRSEAAAFLHGKVISLVKRSPTADDPRVFSLKQISGGHRFPMGLARQRDGELFVTDNQGNYNPFNELNHVIQDSRYGFINKLERKEGFAPKLTPPAINIPHPWTRSVNGICFLDTPRQVRGQTGRDLFGAFEGHLVGCEYDTRRLIRMSLQKVGETYQGAAYPFSFDKPKEGPPLLGPLTCAVAPDGDLYVGGIRDSGWGGANNIGSLVRLKPLADELSPGIAEVRANHDGFEIHFTRPVDIERAKDKAGYAISSYTRDSTPAYGGSDKDRRSETIRNIEVSDNGRAVRLQLNELRIGFVYEFRLKNLSVEAGLFFPDEAFYTLNQIPQ